MIIPLLFELPPFTSFGALECAASLPASSSRIAEVMAPLVPDRVAGGLAGLEEVDLACSSPSAGEPGGFFAQQNIFSRNETQEATRLEEGPVVEVGMGGGGGSPWREDGRGSGVMIGVDFGGEGRMGTVCDADGIRRGAG